MYRNTQRKEHARLHQGCAGSKLHIWEILRDKQFSFFNIYILRKKEEKRPKTAKGSISVEDIKAKMQASIEKGGSLPKVEAKFINYVKNCFRMTDQEVT